LKWLAAWFDDSKRKAMDAKGTVMAVNSTAKYS